MRVRLNERDIDVADGTFVFALRDARKRDADVVIVNGAPCASDRALVDGDTVALIRRGEVPSPDELEALMAARHTPGVHARLKCATVGVAGLGGLGASVAWALARVGVGRLVLADFDVVEPSNLNRQQYFVDQIGQYKTDATLANLARVNPYVVATTHTVRLAPSNVPVIFRDVDVLVEAFDTADGKAMLAETFCRAFPGRPIVMASGVAGHFTANTIETRRMGAGMFVAGDLVNAAAPGTGLMAPRVGVAAHHQATAVLRILLGESPTE